MHRTLFHISLLKICMHEISMLSFSLKTRLKAKSARLILLIIHFLFQVGVGFNRDKWEHLERYVRGTTKIYKNVYVCTGPLYLPQAESDGKNYVKYQVIGANNVAVPTHFFKILVGETSDLQLEMEAYVLPNKAISDDTALASFMVRIQCIMKYEMDPK